MNRLIAYTDTIVRLRPTIAPDRYGDPREDWTDPHEHPIERVNVQPNYQRETVAGRAADPSRDLTVTGWSVHARRDLDVTAADRIRYRGVTCRVIGEIARWPDPKTGAVHNVEFVIERRTG